MNRVREPGAGAGEPVAATPGRSLRFRVAGAPDVGAVVALTESAYRGDASRAGWTTEADLLDGQRTDAREVAGLVADPDVRVLLAEQGGELLASCVLRRLAGEHAGDGYFGMFSVRPDRQGRGTGSAVLAEAERMLRDDWHCAALRMTVIDVRAELIAWYERHGYRRTGEHQAFPYGDPRFGVPKRDDLRFEWLVKDLRSPATARDRRGAAAAGDGTNGGGRG